MQITTSSLKQLRYEKAGNKADIRFDDELRGFGVRVYPSGRLSFILSYRNASGEKKRITLGDFGSLTVKQARAMAKDRLYEVRQGRDPSSERKARRQEMTFGDLAKDYLSHAADHKRSIKSDRQRLRDHILPDLAGRKLSEISLRQLQQLHSGIKAKTSASTANRCAALLKRMLNVAIEWGHLKTSPAEALKLFKEPPPRDIRLSPEECRRLIDACNADENIFARSLFLLAMFTGRRIGELQNAKWENLDRERGLLTVHETKPGERQHIVLDGSALAILDGIPKLESNPYIIAGDKPGKPIVFYRRAWMRILKRAGMNRFPPHGLRHNYASALVANGVPLDTVRHLLGHKSSITTLKYAHHRPDELRQATSTFTSLIRPLDDRTRQQ
ncbi:site-specific integrase [Microvirga sp. 17 mud 1-3]|uniref:tyrosine-type recombinase/integrase n=1 Tax=Microvirga sp. 17 mud 1-3 TaxID=2082949 RepID=UPI000D6B16DC|nr:site-specific integrase [Microvirga sp. 17 mud 1-3]AWM86102.1 hypothetical protein C4E04_04675 [Microvirga sp. 17 mud 1-3]